MAGGFQTSVSDQPAIGVAGDFANTNPYFSVPFGPGGAVAGANGAVVGRFQWSVPPTDGDGAPAQINSFGTGPVTGFLYRKQQGLITTYLADASMVVPQGFQLGLASGGDFLAKNDGSNQALPGMKAYANFADGKITFAASGAPSGATAGAWTIAAATNGWTGSIADSVLTVTGGVTGVIYPGTVITGAGVASGTRIINQISGTAGGIGTYGISIPEQTVASEAMTGTYGLFTATTVATGVFGVGNTLTAATPLGAATNITALITGTGGSGSTFAVNPTQTSSFGANGVLTAATNVETKFYAMSSGLAGELVKISDHPLG